MAEPAPQLPETFDASKAVSLSLGMASPLWFAFAGAAVAGSAFWWMSRWTRPENLEALLAAPVLSLTPGIATIADEKAVEQAAAAVEPIVEVLATATETAMEVAATETAAMAEGLADVDPVVDTAPVARAAVDAVQTVADDLTRLVGVGPKLAASLTDMGVTSFAQIAAWSADDLAKFDTALSLKGRAARDAWVAQARRFADA